MLEKQKNTLIETCPQLTHPVKHLQNIFFLSTRLGRGSRAAMLFAASRMCQYEKVMQEKHKQL